MALSAWLPAEEAPGEQEEQKGITDLTGGGGHNGMETTWVSPAWDAFVPGGATNQ